MVIIYIFWRGKSYIVYIIFYTFTVYINFMLDVELN